MKIQKYSTYMLATVLALIVPQVITVGAVEDGAMRDELKDSLVYIDVYYQGYSNYLPWKKNDVTNGSFYGCAVSQNQIITTAKAVESSNYIKIKLYGQNEFVTAKVKAIDYSLNLALLDLSNEELKTELEPIVLGEYKQGDKLDIYWLDPRGDVITGRAYMDKAQVNDSVTSHTNTLEYVAASVSQESGWGEIVYDGDKAVGIACWYNEDSMETGIIPAETIKAFLSQAMKDSYLGFGKTGFRNSKLIDPTRRKFLKLPDNFEGGVIVTDVFTIGSGCDVIKKDDVIIEVDGNEINAYGRFEHPEYRSIYFEYLITSAPVGKKLNIVVYRNGEKKKLEVEVEDFKDSEMMIPYDVHGLQPEYIVRGGFVFQRLTRNYLQLWGDGWSGKVQPYLFDYYKKFLFKPTPERNEIVILSQVIPADINIGYQGLRQMVVEKVNGKKIRNIADMFEAFNDESAGAFDVVELELNSPTIVIDRSNVEAADREIAMKYNIPQLSHQK